MILKILYAKKNASVVGLYIISAVYYSKSNR